MTPFETVYGRLPPHILTYMSDPTQDRNVAVALNSRDNALQVLKDNLQLAQARMKKFDDTKRTDRVF